MSKANKYVIATLIKGIDKGIGDTVSMSEKDAAPLLKCGALLLVPKVNESLSSSGKNGKRSSKAKNDDIDNEGWQDGDNEDSSQCESDSAECSCEDSSESEE